MSQIDRIARDAGFTNSEDLMTCTDPSKVTQFSGIDIVGEPLMPEGWLGMRADKGVMCLGPDGKSLWVPAFDLNNLLEKKFGLKEGD